MQYAMLFNQSRCVGCNTCVVSCKDWNEIKPGRLRLRSHKELTEGRLPAFGELKDGGKSGFKVYNMLYACYHCDTPKCLMACGLGAIKKDPATGIVFLDQTVCQGMRSCETIAGCPYNFVDHVEEDNPQAVQRQGWLIPNPGHKCNMCHTRVLAGQLPVCVASCLARALDFGAVEELRGKYPEMTQKDVPGFEDKGTGANWFFIKK